MISNVPSPTRRVSGVVVMGFMALVAGCSSGSGSTSSSISAEQLSGAFQGDEQAAIAWFRFFPPDQYELQRAGCVAGGCVIDGSYEIRDSDTLAISDDGTGHPRRFP